MDTTLDLVRRELAAATWESDADASLASVLARLMASSARIERATREAARKSRVGR